MTNQQLFFWVFGVVFVIGCFLYWRRRQGSGTAFGSTLVNMSDKAIQGAYDTVAGREDELERMMHILLRRTKNNPLLIGEPGVGKTALVEELARRIASKDVPTSLQGKQVLALDLPSLVSDTKYRGEMEKRLQAMLNDIHAMQGRAILFIDEIHMLGQMSGADGSLNVSDILKPTLARGEVQVIGATTWKEYKESIHQDQAFDRRFQPVIVEEPSPQDALAMLEHASNVYEEFHHVRIAPAALKAAVDLSRKHIRDRYLPDKAIDVIDEACAKVAIEFAKTHHGAALGAIHAAAKKGQPRVEVSDIEEVIEEWVPHQKRG